MFTIKDIEDEKVTIVGFKYHCYVKTQFAIEEGTKLILKREYGNPHDEYAVDRGGQYQYKGNHKQSSKHQNRKLW